MCDCSKTISIEDGVDISYNNGFLTRTIDICLDCEYLYIFHCSFGDFLEGKDYDNYEGSFDDFYDKEHLDDLISLAKT